MITEPIYLSKKGIKELKKSIAKLERERAEMQKSLKNLDHGDNREGRLARTERLAHLETIDSELADKQQYMLRAKKLPRRRDAIKVALGSIVDLIDEKGNLIRYQIVDSFEANPSDGRISMNSPLGAELIGRRVKDVVQWSNRNFATNRMQLVAIR